MPEWTSRMPPAEPQVAVLLIAHGSRHAPANDDLFRLTDRISARGDFAIVEPSFLELAAPDIPEAGGRCVARGATRVLMIPYFLSVGVHMIRDLTAARDDLRERHPAVEFRLGSALGPHNLLDDLVSVRISELREAGLGSFDPSPDLANRYEPMTGHVSDPLVENEAVVNRIDTIRSSD